MDVMLHKRCAKFIYVIPEGLRELMSDISREVLRSQPEHIYTFVADYLDALMITRENARVAAKLVESITEIGTTIVELLQRAGMSREQADKMVAVIQNAFRKYMAAKSHQPHVESTVEEEEKEEMSIVSEILDEFGEYSEYEHAAAEIIQKAFRHFRERHDREGDLLTGMIDWRVAARSAIYLYRKSGVTNEEANRAATLIKAAYKGYYTRRIMQRLVDEGRKVYEDEETETIQEEYETESSERLDFTAEETTEETESRTSDSQKFETVPEDFGEFPGSPSMEGHETVAEILQRIIGDFEEPVKDIEEEKVQTSESAPAIEDAYPEGSFTSVQLEESELEAEEPMEPMVTEPEATEQPNNVEITEETFTESPTQIENFADFSIQSDLEPEQTEISEPTQPSTETTEITETDEN